MAPHPESAEIEPPFYPFSIVTSNLGNLNSNDSAYVHLRDHFIEISMALQPEVPTYINKTAGRVILPLIRLGCVSFPHDELGRQIIKHDAHSKGIEFYPGKWVSFVNPERLAKAAQKPKEANTLPIDPLFLEYAKNLTKPPVL